MHDDPTIGEVYRLQQQMLSELVELRREFGSTSQKITALETKVGYLEEHRQNWTGWIVSSIGAVLLAILHWLIYGTNGHGR